MTDEEKKAIERLNKRYEFFKENPLATNVWLTLDIHNLGIALNLIKKLSKEIEELYQDNLTLIQEINKKWEYKIKAKIEEINEKLEYETNGWESEYEYCKEVLQSLLEKE